jgi:hypothetical protein
MLLGLGCKHVIALTDLGVRIDAQRGQNPNILLQLKRTKVRPPDAVTFFGSLPLSSTCETTNAVGGERVKIKIKNKKGFLMQIYDRE